MIFSFIKKYILTTFELKNTLKILNFWSTYIFDNAYFLFLTQSSEHFYTGLVREQLSSKRSRASYTAVARETTVTEKAPQRPFGGSATTIRYHSVAFWRLPSPRRFATDAIRLRSRRRPKQWQSPENFAASRAAVPRPLTTDVGRVWPPFAYDRGVVTSTSRCATSVGRLG